ncbi:MAG: hydrolase TatD [Candidatus Nealsonbacteria bacterium CG_4_10_14_0_2_um_filter_38_17]|uniref:Hydrolase TatD n=2 Tax=Candidatus Nealsoniibacteriota TaxID=1817911 RepID=A0A2M7UXL7_9BACT|nr:MAG: hydrolase TatD [Candidatus Nealsonbacteria bacterium CG23_combo_of_CG06-09_8_20_14_all_38_19]PIZ88697.1 MAG: hydrolase TatD [Candidatus Nealsonbacteria bacterium CG_4_10_14_0_2_um_filter_38_17]
MLIDTHAHLNFNAYKDDADEVIRRALNNGVWMINVGSQYKTSKRAVEIAEKYKEGIFASVGLHPIHLADGIFKTKIDPAEMPNGVRGASKEEIEFETKEEDFDYEKYKELALRRGSGQAKSKVVAIGEIGLDYWYKPKTKTKLSELKEKQREAFLKQLDLAKELNLPVIFHCRMAHDEMIELLNTRYHIQNTNLQGVVHCFTGNWQQAQKYLEMGLYLGFNGIIFKLNLDEVIKKTPLGRILVETDCPYLTPKPMEGRNEPLYVKYVAERIAKVKEIDIQGIEEATTKNALDLFNFKKITVYKPRYL